MPPGRVFSGVGACPMARSLNVDGVFDGWQVWKKSCLAERIHQPVNFGQGSYYALCRKPDTCYINLYNNYYIEFTAELTGFMLFLVSAPLKLSQVGVPWGSV